MLAFGLGLLGGFNPSVAALSPSNILELLSFILTLPENTNRPGSDSQTGGCTRSSLSLGDSPSDLGQMVIDRLDRTRDDY